MDGQAMQKMATGMRDGYKRGLQAAQEELRRAQETVSALAAQVAGQEGAVQALDALIEALEEAAATADMTVPALPADTFEAPLRPLIDTIVPPWPGDAELA